ncbi:MAG TPA: hypothetical protein VF796_28815 [Humisphaera sp.]
MAVRQRINLLAPSAAFADAARRGGLGDVRITLLDAGHGGIAYATGVNADGMPFDLEMVMSGDLREAEPARGH